MDPQQKIHLKGTVEHSDNHAWQPAVLDGEQATRQQKRDFDVSEVWHWYHARLKLLGSLTNAQTRLLALLNWHDHQVNAAIHAARLEVNRMPGDERARQAHLEYLAAEYLARNALDLASIPMIEPHPA